MKRLIAATAICATLVGGSVCSLRAETVGTESNYDRLVREGRNVWQLIDSKLIQTNAVGEWAIPVGLSWPKGICLNYPSAAAGQGVLDLIDAVIVNKDDQVVVDFASAEGHNWYVWFSWESLKNLAATDFRCNRLHAKEGYAAFSGNATLKRVTLGGPQITTFMNYGLSKYVTNVTISAATNLTGFANDAFFGLFGHKCGSLQAA